MTRNRSIFLLADAALVLLATFLLAGCGSGGGSASATPAALTRVNGQPATIGVANNRELGKILVDSQGRTLYLFKNDSGTKSACTGACARVWPPLRSSGKPVVRGGANASLVGSTARSDGTRQAPYNGHPLYRFVMDTKSGDTKGEGRTAFGGTWFAVSRAGNQVTPKPKPKPKPQPLPNPIPQNNGGDHDDDNNGGPSDGDGNI
jgi:predicted lipoprotein with Yx(FWY)xxD motif